MKHYRHIFFILLLNACAQIRPIPGGQKDTIPPNVILYTPDSATTRFSENSFSLVFDEYIQTTSLPQEMVISPPLKKAPGIKLKKKTLTIKWNDTLKVNTTYVFNFGNGIADVNENNIASGLMYVFSTGHYIDSLEINTLCTKASTTEPVKGARVMLLPHDSLLTSSTGLPSSVAFSSDKGLARLPFLSEKSYRLFAVDDQNFNYKWDEGESLAFFDSTVTPRWRDSTIHLMRLSKPRPLAPFIADYKTDSLGRIAFSWDPYFTPPRLLPLDDSTQVFRYYTPQKDSLVYRVLPLVADREVLFRVVWDSITMDTLGVQVYQKALESPWKIRWQNGSKTTPESEHVLEIQRYATLGDVKKWRYKVDSVFYQPNVRSADGIPGQFLVSLPGLKKTKGNLQLLPGALLDMLKGTNDTLQIEWSLLHPEDLGTVKITFENTDTLQHPIVRLTEGSGKWVKDIPLNGRKTLVLDALIPSDYTIYLFDDHNNNGLLDPAVINGFIAPEPLWLVASKINVRANWEITQTFSLR